MENDIFEINDNDFEEMSPETAQGHIDRTLRAARDNENHPYNTGQSPDHKKAVGIMERLYATAKPEAAKQTAGGVPLAEQPSREFVKAESEGLEAQRVRQSDLARQGRAEMDKLVAMGFENENVPNDIKKFQVERLKQEVLLNGGEHEKLKAVLAKELLALNSPVKIMSLFDTYQKVGFDKILQEDVGKRIISEIFHLHKNKGGEKINKNRVGG